MNDHQETLADRIAAFMRSRKDPDGSIRITKKDVGILAALIDRTL